MNKVIQGDNMEYMKTISDNYFELAIVDVPYGSENIKGGYTSNKRSEKGSANPKIYNLSLWKHSAPSKKYWNELFRISKHQIIWGANHFISAIPYDSPCWLVWDKQNENTGFADCELAWCSFDKAVRKFTFRWNGMLQGNMKNKETRIHPTQKPVALYKWLLKNYAKPNDKIFDSHVGSGSIRIACHDMGFDFTGCEIDQDYYNDQENRFKKHIQQGDLFSGQDLQSSIYSNKNNLPLDKS